MRCGCWMGDESRLRRSAWGWRGGPWMRRLSMRRSGRQFGKAISEFQAIQFKLATMATELDAAWLLTMRAARMKDAGKNVTLESSDGEAVCERGGVQDLRGGGADSWRVWVHQGLSGGEVLSGCEAVHDWGRDERDSTDGDCEGAHEEDVSGCRTFVGGGLGRGSRRWAGEAVTLRGWLVCR